MINSSNISLKARKILFEIRQQYDEHSSETSENQLSSNGGSNSSKEKETIETIHSSNVLEELDDGYFL